MAPLHLTDEQLQQVMRTAAPIPPELRDEYLRRVANQLRDSEFGDGQLHRVAHAIVRELMAPPPRQRQRAGPRQEEALRGFDVAP
jgi:hypothetical protein